MTVRHFNAGVYTVTGVLARTFKDYDKMSDERKTLLASLYGPSVLPRGTCNNLAIIINVSGLVYAIGYVSECMLVGEPAKGISSRLQSRLECAATRWCGLYDAKIDVLEARRALSQAEATETQRQADFTSCITPLTHDIDPQHKICTDFEILQQLSEVLKSYVTGGSIELENTAEGIVVTQSKSIYLPELVDTYAGDLISSRSSLYHERLVEVRRHFRFPNPKKVSLKSDSVTGSMQDGFTLSNGVTFYVRKFCFSCCGAPTQDKIDVIKKALMRWEVVKST